MIAGWKKNKDAVLYVKWEGWDRNKSTALRFLPSLMGDNAKTASPSTSSSVLSYPSRRRVRILYCTLINSL